MHNHPPTVVCCLCRLLLWWWFVGAGLVKLLAAHSISSPQSRGGASSAGEVVVAPRSGSGGVARRAADAITNLAHENIEIKNMVRADGGIQPLVRLLNSWDLKVQRAAAGALRTLAFKNDDNKRQIVECGALPLLIQVWTSSACQVWGSLHSGWPAAGSAGWQQPVFAAPARLQSVVLLWGDAFAWRATHSCNQKRLQSLHRCLMLIH